MFISLSDLSCCLNGLKLLFTLQLPKIPGKADAGRELAAEVGRAVPGGPGLAPMSNLVLGVWRLERPGM